MSRRIIPCIVLLLLLLPALSSPFGLVRAADPSVQLNAPVSALRAATHPALPEASTEVEPLILEELAANGQTDFFVWLAEKADLTPADQLQTKEEKGRYVFEALGATAERTQASLRRELDRQNVRYKPFYIANKILIYDGDLTLLQALAGQPDVARITANHQYQIDFPDLEPGSRPAPQAVAPNISWVRGNLVWGLGYTGQGIVLSGIDTGVQWIHPALLTHYRGCLNPPACTSWDHNYNWWDAQGEFPAAPWDTRGHGTHTTGTMVGDDGGANQIGMAPGARWTHCRAFGGPGGGTDEVLTECMQWQLAPWNLEGQDPRPELAPDAVNGSWGFPGAYPEFEDEIDALQAAGIAMEFSAGNEGPMCNTLISPADYQQVLSTGALRYHNTTYPGVLSNFSSRGPSELYPEAYIPDVVAPGERVWSSTPGGTYGYGQGTSMAGPHATGLIALLWSVNPALRGHVQLTYDIIKDTAVPLTGQYGSNCGGDYVNGPNYDWGEGLIDAYAAALAALALGEPGHLVGQVTDAVTTLPISDSLVLAERGDGQVWDGLSGADGSYDILLLPDVFTVTASAFGYFSSTVGSVAVSPGMTTVQDLALSPLPQYVISGTVREAGTGAPLAARVEAIQVPIAPVWTDPTTGYYSLTLPAGTYTLQAWSAQHDRVRRQIVADHHQTQDLNLPPLSCILLVDDDEDTPDLHGYYTAALDNLGYSYTVWDTLAEGLPTAEEFDGRRIIVWYEGCRGTLTEEGEQTMATYLDSGGNLLFSAVDYLWEEGVTPFAQDYLGITAFTGDKGERDVFGNAGSPIGAGLGPYWLYPPAGWHGWVWTDYITGTAAPFQFQSTGHDNSTSYDGGTYKTVYLAWPLEAITATNGPAEVLGAVVDWFGGCCDPVSDADFTWTCSREKVWGELRSPRLSPWQNSCITMQEFCTPTVGQMVTFTGTATGTLPISYSWKLDVGSWKTGQVITYSYALSGVYTVVMTATNCGTATATVAHTLTVLPEPSPPCEPVHSVLFDWTPLAPVAGQVVTFTGEASGTLPISYTWDFGDGTRGQITPPSRLGRGAGGVGLEGGQGGRSVTHTYALPGLYTVTLTATNCVSATAQASAVITVLPEPVEYYVYLPWVIGHRCWRQLP